MLNSHDSLLVDPDNTTDFDVKLGWTDLPEANGISVSISILVAKLMFNEKNKIRKERDTMEYITANGTKYECQNIETKTNEISFTLKGDLDVLKSAFKEVTSLTVSAEDDVVYGNYENLRYRSVTEYDDGTVEITMKILTDVEIAVEDLQKTQAEQDEAIAELVGGGADVE